jgi:hypothetical protein
VLPAWARALFKIALNQLHTALAVSTERGQRHSGHNTHWVLGLEDVINWQGQSCDTTKNHDSVTVSCAPTQAMSSGLQYVRDSQVAHGE